MISNDELCNAFAKKKGILQTYELYDLGLSKYDIKNLLQADVLERILKGYFKLAAKDFTEAELIQRLYPDSVICMDSALFYYGYSDRTPIEWHLAVDKDISKARFNIDYPQIKPYYLEPYLLKLGVENGLFEKLHLKIFSRDRVICDCLFYEMKMDIEIFNKAILNYIKDPQKNISKLMEYAKVRKVEKKVYNKIGTWL